MLCTANMCIVACVVVAWLLQYLPSRVGTRVTAMYCMEGGSYCRGDYLSKKVSVLYADCMCV